MTLNKIKVKDFQSIDKGEVELGRFTVFTGPSSSGKSAFVRAAQAVVRNGFTPAQVRMGTKETVVSVEFEDHVVEAHRGKSKSTYVLDGEEYTKAGRSVPPAVEKSLRMPLIAEIDTSFSTQFDKPYLIADPGSTAAKVLGTLTNVRVLHEGLRETNRRALEVKSRLKVKSSDLEDVTSKIEAYEDLDEKLDSLEAAQELLEALEAKEAQAAGLEKALIELENLETSLRNAAGSITDVGPLAQEVGELDERVRELTALNSLAIRIETSASKMPRWEFNSVPEYDDELDHGLERAANLTALLTQISSKVLAFKKAGALAQSSLAQMQEKEDEFDMLMSDLEVCPLCLNPMNGEHRD